MGDGSSEANDESDSVVVDDAVSLIMTDEEKEEKKNYDRLGLAGFAVDADLGFCAILIMMMTSEEGSNNNNNGNDDVETHQSNKMLFVPVVIAPSDRQGPLQAAESLLMVQLSGGMDLGTALLPPDTLAQLVAEELIRLEEEERQISLQQETRSDDNDDDDDVDEQPSPSLTLDPRAVIQLRSMIQLVQIKAIPNPQHKCDSNNHNDAQDGTTTMMEIGEITSSAERERAIQEQAPNVWKAVQQLPGLQQCTLKQVTTAMQLHADVETGKVDRTAFSFILDVLRRQMGTMSVAMTGSSSNSSNGSLSSSPILFELHVRLNMDPEPQDLIVTLENPVQALGLSLRYKVKVDVAHDCAPLGQDVSTLLDRFPLFRPLSELEEDAKRMDRFIPSMFAQASSSSSLSRPLTNEDKM